MIHITLPHIASGLGQTLDFVGVLLLGFDLIRLQRSLRNEASLRLSGISALYDEFVPPEEWTEEVKRLSESIHSFNRGFSDDHSDNIDQLGNAMREAAGALDFISIRLGSLAKLERQRSEQDARSAAVSYRLSVVGFALILAGYVFQVIGTFAS